MLGRLKILIDHCLSYLDDNIFDICHNISYRTKRRTAQVFSVIHGVLYPVVKFRPMRSTKDVIAVQEIDFMVFPHFWQKEDFTPYYKSDNKFCHILENNKEIVAYICFQVCEMESCVYLTRLAVPENHRGKGYGRKCIDNLINHTIDQKKPEIRIFVRESNLEGQTFFRKMGFTATKIVRRHFNNEDAYLMTMNVIHPTLATV